MVGFQGLVNGWIKVNKNHVKFPADDSPSGGEKTQQNGSTTVAVGEAMMNADVGNGSTASLSSASVTPGGPSGERASGGTVQRRALHVRRKNRKLQRTVSHTDLLREMAKERELEQKTKSHQERQRAELEDIAVALRDEEEAVREAEEAAASGVVAQSNSLRHAAGFFGAEMDSQQQQQQHPAVHPPVNTGRLHHRTLSAGSGMSASRPTTEASSSIRSGRGEEVENLAAAARSHTPPLQKQQQDSSSRATPNPIQQMFGFVHSKHCQSCEELETRLLAANADIEYLRSVALRNEYVCSECSSQQQKQQQQISAEASSSTKLTDEDERRGSLSLGAASQRWSGLSQEHQQQETQASLEQASLYRESKSKISRLSSLFEGLKEEVCVRKQDAELIRRDLEQVTQERDALKTQVAELQRQMDLQDHDKKDYNKLKQLLASYQGKGLEKAHSVIQQQKRVIVDLTGRLEQAFATMETERQKHLQRRQIIFPARTAAVSSVVTGPGIGGVSLEELNKAKDAAARAQAELEVAKLEAERNQRMWMEKFQQLERDRLEEQIKWA
mmetsp:Transcript_27277/g.39965  ORF Transcript_27277/g.39965 Transcript_27277/m.39965 type:complete len:558 (-) Transcript_27277:306-1979(-)